MIRILLLAAAVTVTPSTPDAPGPIDQMVTAGSSLVLAITQVMPIWDRDPIGQYERAEIALVKEDILACSTAATNNDFLIDVEQLRADYKALIVLDKSLQTAVVL